MYTHSDRHLRELVEPCPDNSCTIDKIIDGSCPIPKQRGVYSWYFRNYPKNIPSEGCVHFEDKTLLYIGIAPSEQNKRTSSSTLFSRIRGQHVKGNARSSTLRRSLGCLLSEQLGIKFEGNDNRRKPFTQESEKKLTEWMLQNALVVWTLHDEPWKLEEEFINKLSPPLNLVHNRHHAFYTVLKAIRSNGLTIHSMEMDKVSNQNA